MKREELIEMFEGGDGGDMEEILACKCTAMEGLLILSKYTDESVVIGASHDIIYSIDVDTAINGGLTKEEAGRLKSLNWAIRDEEYFAHFI